MKLHSLQFEKGLRRAVKKAVRSSPALKREAKRGKLRRFFSAGPALRLIGSVVLATLVWQSYQATSQVATSLAVMSLWLFLMAFFRAANLLACLFQSPDLAALNCLPIGIAEVFRWQRQRFFFSSIYSVVDILAGFIVLSAACELPPVGWIALLPLTFVAALGLVGAAGLLAARFPQMTKLVPVAIFPGVFALLVFGRLISLEAIWHLLDRQATWINLLLPTGWAISLFQLLPPSPHWTALTFVPLTAALIGSLWNSFARLRQNYEFKEVEIPELPDLIPGEVTALVPEAEAGHAPRHLGVTAIEEIVRARQFFAPPVWSNGAWLERRLWAWLTPRERVLADFVFLDGLPLSAAWKNIYRNLTVGVVAGVATSLASPVLGAWVLGIGLFVALCQMLAQFLATGTAFEKTLCSGVNIPVYAVHPVGFHELSRLLFKHAAIQLPCVTPFMIIAALLIGRMFGLPGVSVWPATVLGCKAACLLTTARLPLIALGFSSGTNDSSQLKFRSLFLLMMFVLLGLMFAALGGAALLVPAIWLSWMFCLLAGLDALAIFGIYGWVFNANRFDLMSLPDR